MAVIAAADRPKESFVPRLSTYRSNLRQLLLVLPLFYGATPAGATLPDQQARADRATQALVDSAWRYYLGAGTARDDVAAARLFRAASGRGNPGGMYGLALCYRLGRGVERDLPRADALMAQALDLGDTDAQVDAGVTAAAADQPAQAMNWYARAAQQGNSDGMWRLARLYQNGSVEPADAVKALALLRRSAGNDNVIGMYYLAVALRDGSGTAPDQPGARAWFAKAAERGDADARFALAEMLAKGAGGARDVNGAIQMYRAGAAQEHGDSMYALAVRYDDGEGVHQDHAQASVWLDKGVALGDARAMVVLGMHYLYGMDRPIDLEAAAGCFKRAADLGNARGIYMLGRSLEEGKGVTRDPVAAVAAYRRAAEMGAWGAANRLLAMQLGGIGMPPDRAGALAAVDKAIADGGAEKMLALAVLLLARKQDADADLVVQRALTAPAPAPSRATRAFADALGEVGTAYFQRQRLDQSGVHLKAYLALLEQLPDVPPAVLAAALEKRGDQASQEGRLDQAEPLYARALKLRLRASGEHDAGVAEAYGNMADVYAGTDRLASAVAYRRRKVDISEAIFGTGATQTERAHVALATTLYLQGKYGEAQPLFQSALAGIEATQGTAHPSLRTPVNNLAYNDLALGRYAESERGFLRVLALVRADEGPAPSHEMASALNGLGAAQTGAGKYPEAEQQLLAGLAMREQVLGKDHYDVAISLTNLGKLYIAMGRYGDADQALARARPIIEAMTSKDHSEVAVIEHEQGRSEYRQGKAAEAKLRLVHALAIRLRTRPGHPDTAQTATLLATLYREEGNETAALRVEHDAKAAADSALAAAAVAVDTAG